MKDFEDLWENKTKYVDVCDFMYAEKNNLLKIFNKNGLQKFKIQQYLLILLYFQRNSFY